MPELHGMSGLSRADRLQDGLCARGCDYNAAQRQIQLLRRGGMDKNERREIANRVREKREQEAQLAALRQIRDNPQATPGERLEAVKLLMELNEEE